MFDHQKNIRFNPNDHHSQNSQGMRFQNYAFSHSQRYQEPDFSYQSFRNPDASFNQSFIGFDPNQSINMPNYSQCQNQILVNSQNHKLSQQKQEQKKKAATAHLLYMKIKDAFEDKVSGLKSDILGKLSSLEVERPNKNNQNFLTKEEFAEEINNLEQKMDNFLNMIDNKIKSGVNKELKSLKTQMNKKFTNMTNQNKKMEKIIKKEFNEAWKDQEVLIKEGNDQIIKEIGNLLNKNDKKNEKRIKLLRKNMNDQFKTTNSRIDKVEDTVKNKILEFVQKAEKLEKLAQNKKNDGNVSSKKKWAHSASKESFVEDHKRFSPKSIYNSKNKKEFYRNSYLLSQNDQNNIRNTQKKSDMVLEPHTDDYEDKTPKNKILWSQNCNMELETYKKTVNKAKVSFFIEKDKNSCSNHQILSQRSNQRVNTQELYVESIKNDFDKNLTKKKKRRAKPNMDIFKKFSTKTQVSK